LDLRFLHDARRGGEGCLAGVVASFFLGVSDRLAAGHPIGGGEAKVDVLRMSGSSFEREQRDNKGG
jgi:hypothetical protein